MLSNCTKEVERTRLVVREDTSVLMDAAKAGDEETEEQTVRMAPGRNEPRSKGPWKQHRRSRTDPPSATSASRSSATSPSAPAPYP
jgi:hypothetical protein